MGDAQATQGARAAAGSPGKSSWQPFWTTRAFSAIGLSPVAVGPVLGLAALLVFALQELALGRFALAVLPGDPEGVLDGVRLTLTHIAIVVYLVTAAAYATRVTKRTLVRLRPLLEPAPSLDRDPQERYPLRIAGLLSIGLILLVNATVSPGDVSYNPATWNPENGWHRVLSFAIGFWAFRLVAVIAIDSLRLSRLARSIREVDLLDLRPLAPFVTQGLANVLLVTGFVAVFALFVVDPRYLTLFVPTFLITMLAAAVALALPVWGCHQHIQTAKRGELSWCRHRIREARQELAQGRAGTGLDEFLAWEERIERVRAWPFDAAVLARFALYLLIPVGSWSGGALVERLIDSLLD